MNKVDKPSVTAEPAIIIGPPLSEEPLGALTLPGYLREVTARFASREALVMHMPEGVVRWSYAELWERANEVARSLLACDMGKGSRVGVMMTNRPEWISAMFGVGLAGGVAVTISTFSTPPELEYILQASGVAILLFEQMVVKKDFAAILRELEPEIAKARPGALVSIKFPFLRRLAVVGGGEGGAIESWSTFLAQGQTTAQALVEATTATVTPADPGALFFSSGSTAKPKGILSAHRGVAIQLWRWRWMFNVGDDVRTWTANGFFWSGNFGMALGSTFSSGGSLVLQATFNAAEALELMEKERVTLPLAWPHQWAQIDSAPNFDKVDLSSLKYVDASRPVARHPTFKASWVEPVWTYGNTETFTIVTAYPNGTPREVAGDSHGIALPGCRLKIVDVETGEVLPRGQAGEIAVKGATLMLGYIGIPLDETLDEDGFFRTGDGGTIDDRGRLFWHGRLTDIIKTGGANVSPAEVDSILSTYPGVKATQTVGIPHDTLGEMVVGCIVPHEGAKLEEDSIREFLKARLAAYKVPRRVLFFREDEFSLTGSAKIKSGALRELVAKRLSDGIADPTSSTQLRS